MKIVKIEDLHCNAGWRDFSFLKIATDEGLIGWSEYNEGYGSAGLTAVIRRMAQDLIGNDPRPIERIMARQQAITRQAPGGLNQQAMAAIENALLDVKAKALGIPVHALFGGRCAIACRSTGRIAAAIVSATPRSWASSPCARSTTW
jgi:galactonate dehydratase